MTLALIQISKPTGAPWEFLVVFAVLLIGPVLFRRFGISGIIGLLVGGYAIGPHGLSLIGAGNDTLPDLGQLGLLYLMFVAGVEIDLNLLRKYRRSAVSFGVLTFVLPFALGMLVGFALGWETLAAILLGSLLASHTLISYPAIKDAGLASDPAVATAVGSTVLTDTLALVVLAVVAGSAGGHRSTADIAAQIVVGMGVLAIYSLIVLPILAGWAFRWFGTERAVRYVVPLGRDGRRAVRHRGNRRRVLRRPRHEPAGAERGPADGPHRVLRRRRVHPGVPRLRRPHPQPERYGSR